MFLNTISFILTIVSLLGVQGEDHSTSWGEVRGLRQLLHFSMGSRDLT